MPEFLEAMDNLVRERFPTYRVRLWNLDLGYTSVLMIYSETKFAISDGKIECFYHDFDSADETMRFDITNPEFDPEDLIKWIKEHARIL